MPIEEPWVFVLLLTAPIRPPDDPADCSEAQRTEEPAAADVAA